MSYLSKKHKYISVDMTLQEPTRIGNKNFGNDIFMSFDKFCFKFCRLNYWQALLKGVSVKKNKNGFILRFHIFKTS